MLRLASLYKSLVPRSMVKLNGHLGCENAKLNRFTDFHCVSVMRETLQITLSNAFKLL